MYYCAITFIIIFFFKLGNMRAAKLLFLKNKYRTRRTSGTQQLFLQELIQTTIN